MYTWNHRLNPLKKTSPVQSRRLRLERLEDRRLLSAVPFSETFSLHSVPDSRYSIYLDFDGHTTSGTIWNSQKNGGQDIVTPAFDTDGDASSLSDSELELIQQIWAFASEAFSSFDVDVTTAEPTMGELQKSGNSDTAWGIRVVIGGSCADWYGTEESASGVAYINSFNYDTDTPCFVFEESLFNSPDSVAMTIAHEVGHALGLSHDSTSTEEYYPGANGWSPIMGGGSGPVFQWSKGEYAGATNTQDDLQIISTQNGFGYRSDDFGNSRAASQAIQVNSDNEFAQTGRIETNTDVDYFKIVLSSKDDFYAAVSPSNYNSSLDAKLELRNASGTVLSLSAPDNSRGAEIIINGLTAGTYYLTVGNDGCGSAYSSYGSIGSYSLSGCIGASTLTTVTTAEDVSDSSDGVVSLREAIANASTGDRIVFSNSVFSPGSQITLNRELVINKSITIDASAFYDRQKQEPGIVVSTISGRIINLSGASTSNQVTLVGLGLTGGNVEDDVEGDIEDQNDYGGAIFAAGSLTLKNCAVYDNYAYYGGAIGSATAAVGITLINSSLTGNRSVRGGAIMVANRLSVVTMDGCNVSGNLATYFGGAMYARYSCAVFTVNNSVISGNKSYSEAIYNYGAIHVQNSTIAGNVAYYETAGVLFGGGRNTHTVVNSIIAENASQSDTCFDVIADGTVTVEYSLIGNGSGITSGDGNYIGTAKNLQEPGFQSFTPITYETWTDDAWKSWNLSLSPIYSVAINAGSNSLASSFFNVSGESGLRELKDVTGVSSRLYGSAIDMGAYESEQLVSVVSEIDLSMDEPNVGKTLTASTLPRCAAVTYQWYRGSSPNGPFSIIAGAADAAYVPTTDDLGKNLKCVATGINGYTGSVSAISQTVRLAEIESAVVTTLEDVVDKYDMQISLREAIEYAFANGDSVVSFDSALSGGTIILDAALGELVLSNPVSIDASNLYHADTRTPGIVIQASEGRLFNVSGGTDAVPVTLVGLSLTGGNTTECGGAILAQDVLHVKDCFLYGNQTTDQGGAIGSNGYGTTILIDNCVLSGNSGSSGGAIALTDSMNTLTLNQSIVSGNKANNYGGAMYASWSCAVININNSLVSGNKSYSCALYNSGAINIQSSTIAGNVVYYGTAGVLFGGGESTHTVKNSIIACNSSYSSKNADIGANETVTACYSLIGNGDVTGLVLSEGNVSGTLSSPADPGFRSFSEVSYSTWTSSAWRFWDLSLNSTSPAVNAGANSLAYELWDVDNASQLAALKDASGTRTRLSGSKIDMGAYEYNSNLRSLSDLTISTQSPKVGTPISAALASSEDTATYQWFRSSSATGAFSEIAGMNSASYTPTTSDLGNYLKCVASGTGNNYGIVSAAASGYVTQTLLAPELNSSAVSGTTVEIGWSAVPNAYKYTLEYKTSPESVWTTVSPLSNTAATFTGVEGTTYDVRVKALGNGTTYTESGYSETGQVRVPGPLELENDFAQTGLNQNCTIDITANDSLRYKSSTIITSSQPLHGTAILQADGTIRYTPTTGFWGKDSFTYTAAYNGNQASATVEVLVQLPIQGIVQKNRNEYGDAAPESMPTSPASVTDWDTVYMELWSDQAPVKPNAVNSLTLSYDPNVYQSVVVDQTAPGVEAAVSEPEISAQGLATVEIVLTTDSRLVVPVKTTAWWGAVRLIPNTAKNSGVASQSAPQNLAAINGQEIACEAHGVAFDLERDGQINMQDFILFAQSFNQKSINGEKLPADFDNSGTVDMQDFITFAQNYNKKKTDTAVSLVIPSPVGPSASASPVVQGAQAPCPQFPIATEAVSPSFVAVETAVVEAASPIDSPVDSPVAASAKELASPAGAGVLDVPRPVAASPVFSETVDKPKFSASGSSSSRNDPLEPIPTAEVLGTSLAVRLLDAVMSELEFGLTKSAELSESMDIADSIKINYLWNDDFDALLPFQN